MPEARLIAEERCSPFAWVHCNRLFGRSSSGPVAKGARMNGILGRSPVDPPTSLPAFVKASCWQANQSASEPRQAKVVHRVKQRRWTDRVVISDHHLQRDPRFSRLLSGRRLNHVTPQKCFVYAQEWRSTVSLLHRPHVRRPARLTAHNSGNAHTRRMASRGASTRRRVHRRTPALAFEST